jgi:hypothetical protein
MELVRLIKMDLIEMHSEVHIDKYLPDTFPVQNGLEQGDVLLAFLSTSI